MSWLNWNKWSDLTAVLNGGTVRRRKSSLAGRNRRLMLDPLEERALLTVVPGHVDDQLVAAMSDLTTQYTLSAQSVASDHDGNFVVTWTREDVIEGTDDTEANIYARYYTDEVQRITLPQSVLANTNANNFGALDLKYGGNEIQRLSITGTHPGPNDSAANVMGQITLGFDVDGNDAIDPGETATFVFMEGLPVADNAQAIQDALRTIGGALADVEVEGINPQTYNIRFGDASDGDPQPRIVVDSTNFVDGFLPAVQIDKIREPVVISGIPISPDDPYATATAIETWFEYYATGVFPIGPINFPPPSAVPPAGPYSSPLSMSAGVPQISVVPVFGLGENRELVTFDITFIGDSAKTDHPELVIDEVRDESGTALDLTPTPEEAIGVVTIKEPSPEFRVNPEEPDYAFTPYLDKFDQTAPAVAMDADGDFVIVWQSEVPSWENYGSVIDIFARRFSPVGVNIDPAEVDGYLVPGVRALETSEPYYQTGFDPFTFRVNNFTTGAKTQPAIGMDDDGNFVIAWSSSGQDISFFNGIVAQRFSRDGERLGNEWLVNDEDTEIHNDPFVGMSHDGYFLVSWTMPQFGLIMGELYAPYDPDNVLSLDALVDQFTIGGGGSSTSSFDMDRNFVVGWDALRDDDNIGITSAGSFACQFGMNFSIAGDFTGLSLLRSEFRINSASFDPDSAPLWPLGQGGHQVALDADGDMVVSYEGFGPDASYNTFIPTSWYVEQFMRPENADLLAYFSGMPMDRFFYNSGDVTGEIEEVLFLAQDAGANDEQLGRLRAILDDVATLMRGEANGIMYSRWDADPVLGQLNILDSDSIVNATRDGHNQRYIIALERSDEYNWDSFRLRLSHPSVPGYEDVRVYVVRNADGTVNMDYTADAINTALRNAQRTGVNWPWNSFEGPIDVRVVSRDELELRDDTHWDLIDPDLPGGGVDYTGADDPFENYVFEVTFQGEVHDTPMSIVAMDGGWIRNEIQTLTFTANPTAGGYLTLSFGGDKSDPIYIPAGVTLEQIAGILRSAIVGQFDDLEGVEVEYVEGSTYAFRVHFAGDSGGTNHPQITGAPEAGTTADPLTPIPGGIIAATVENGGLVIRIDQQPNAFIHTNATAGTRQMASSIGMTPEGDFVVAWTQIDLYTNGIPAGTSVHFRTFNETTDTAGPTVTDFVAPDGNAIDDEETIVGPLSHLVVTFDEEMLSFDPAKLEWALQRRDELEAEGKTIPQDVARILDSVTNPENYVLVRNGVELENGIAKIEFGMNKAADLAGKIDPLTGEVYAVSAVPTNKWQAVLTLDASNGAAAVAEPFSGGLYELTLLRPRPASATDPGTSGLRDKSGNPLAYTGFTAGQFGQDFTQSFVVTLGVTEDDPIGDLPTPPVPTEYGPGVTYPESRAVAVDGDGDHVVAWTLQIDDVDRAVVQLYNADGSAAATRPYLFNVTEGETQYDGLEQRYAAVAADPDGDFIVTWTQYDPVANPAPNAPTHEANVYARRFNAAGDALGASFLVNDYTTGDQMWSDVAMDAEGNFVITWSSFSQEDGGQLGTGWGVYARRYDLFGQELSPEFQVNYTTAGSQQFSKVAMAGDGSFVIVWQSDQDGVSTDIVARRYGADGSPLEGPWGGEIAVNTTTLGNQRYPDVAINLAGDQFVVTWSSYGQDGSGEAVYSRVFRPAGTVRYPSTQTDVRIPDPGTVESRTLVEDNFLLREVKVHLEIIHPRPHDLRVTLISPSGTAVMLFDEVPEPLENGSQPGGRDFIGTILDDGAAVSITDSDSGAVPPFSTSYKPEQLLSVLQGESVNGYWTLRVTDRVGGPVAPQYIRRWSLEVLTDDAAGSEFRVNTSTTGNQMYPSIAMDYQGNFTVAWSGQGDQTGQQDSSGVFYQRFTSGAQRDGGEQRANIQTTGQQRAPTISSDSEGNVVIVWTGPDETSGESNVFRFVSVNNMPADDIVGPIVTEVFGPDGSRILPGEAFEVTGPGLQELTVVFNEQLSVKNGESGLDSVLNRDNWVLLRNGSEIIGGVSNVSLVRNPATRKWEATVTFDGNGTSAGAPVLDFGTYSLVVNDLVTDGANALDGDFDGFAGTYPGAMGYSGYRFDFIVADGPRYDAEFRVNEATGPEQAVSQSYGTGFAREQSRRAVAADHDGNFAVVWTSYGQENPDGDVYLRVYDRNNVALTGDVRVNQTTAGHQRNASIAMSASGDFVVVWESEGQDPDGSRGVFARLYNAAGQAMTDEFRVNTDTANDQFNAAAAMDPYGNFVVVWATAGQSFSYFNDIKGQLFDYAGRRIGSEFRVNQENIPGTALTPGSNEVNPTVAMDAQGGFVVAWDQNVVQTNGVVTDSHVVARMFDQFGNPRLNADTDTTDEFRVNVSDDAFVSDRFHEPKEDVTTVGGNDLIRTARNAQIAMDLDGNFTIVWESYQDNDLDSTGSPNSYGIYFRRFLADGTPDMEADHQANLVITTPGDEATEPDPAINSDKFAGHQVNPSIAMDADGDYVIVWNGNGAEQHPLMATNPLWVSDDDDAGVWMRRFHAADDQATPEFVSPQTRVNRTEAGVQQFPSVTMTPSGDVIVVWVGTGVGDRHGIFARRYTESTDTAGPMATELRLADGTRVYEGRHVWDNLDENQLSQMTVVFSEAMATTGSGSVTDVANWTLVDGLGQDFSGAIETIDFGLNPATNKWEALFTFTGEGLPSGYYELTAGENLEDLAGNKLRHSGLLSASDSSEPDNDVVRRTRFSFQVAGTPTVGMEFLVNQSPAIVQQLAERFESGSAEETSTRSVAVDHDGDFAVVWVSENQVDGKDVYVRLFNRDNVPLTDEMLVNTTIAGDQWRPAIAMDADGDFVVVWQGDGQDPDGSSGIFGQRFSSVGERLGGEFRVHTDTPNAQFHPAVAMDDDGNFVVVWAAQGQTASYFNDVWGQQFDRDGNRIGMEFMINSSTLPGTENAWGVNPAIGMNSQGRFVVAWEKVTAQQGGVVTDTVVVARVFQFGPTATPVGDEFEVPSTGEGDQGVGPARTARNPSVAVDEAGNYYIAFEAYMGTLGAGGQYRNTWVQSYKFDGNGRSGSLPPLPVSLHAPVNAVNPSVAVDRDGDVIVTSNRYYAEMNPQYPDNPDLVVNYDDEGVWLFRISASGDMVALNTRVNRTARGDQVFSSVAVTPDGDAIVVWQGVGEGDEHGIFARRYHEATDTAGPMVTELMLPDGQRIADGAQLTGSVDGLRIVFDEEMRAGGPGSTFWPSSVLNPDNYQVIKDGVELVDAIVDIDFQLNPATNKWEAILTLDGNGEAPGVVPLLPGDYEVVVRNTVCDVAGNPLGRTGANPDGEPFSMSFNLVDALDPDLPVNTVTIGGQIFRPENGSYNTPDSVAGDADGEHVVVWVDTTAGQQGIYARVYNELRWTNANGERVSSGPVAGTPIRVTSNATAMFASVARDGDGDFVVTWSQNDGTSTSANWNVWARRYDARGNSLGAAFRVNTETESAQLYSSVAMSVDGDFVVTWQSLDQDGSGYGVYAQRFGVDGQRIGGANEVQVLELIGSPEGTFTLSWNPDNNASTPAVTTGPITVTANTGLLAERVQAALNATAGGKNEVEVVALDLRRVAIYFVGAGAAADQEQILVASQNFTRPADGVSTATLIDGNSGEFRVNDTTAGNQMWASIAMDAGGDFVVTWTGETASADTDIYAKQFVSNKAFRLGSDLPGQAGRITNIDDGARWAVTTDHPDNHIVNPGGGYDGIVMTDNGGSGSLLWTGRHILTAAHVVDSGDGTPVNMIGVIFDLPDGPSTVYATEIYIHPGWTGDIFDGNDVAIIVLPYEAPAQSERYDIYRGTNPLNQVVDFVGYGTPGQGAEAGYDGLKRKESNVFEYYGEQLNGLPLADFYMMDTGVFDIPEGSVLIYDFDSGLAENDAFGLLFGNHDVGLGQEEGSASHGDSGGAAFLNGLVAGVTSGGVEYANADSDAAAYNVSFGTIGFFSSTAYHAEWIDLIAQSTSAEFIVNDTLAGAQKWSDVAMDADGDFVITWTSYGQDGDAEGVFAKRYNADGTEVTFDTDGDPATDPVGEFQVNTYTPGKQQYSKVAMDADGDFTIVWESVQDQPVAASGETNLTFGIYAQRYVSNGKLATSALAGAFGQVGRELAINQYKAGNQRFPGITLSDAGDTIIVWSGAGAGDSQGIFMQRIFKTADDAGPTVTDMHAILASGAVERLFPNATIDEPVGQLVVNFGENVRLGSAAVNNAVTNPGNWELTRNGQIIQNAIVSVAFQLNSTTNKYEAIVTLDGNPNTAGAQPLEPGEYVLTLRDRVEDLFGNRLDGDYDGVPGGRFQQTFVIPDTSVGVSDGPGTPGVDATDERVNHEENLNQTSPAVATDAEGNYVVVWATENPGTIEDSGNILAQRYNRYGVKLGAEFVVNSYRTGLQGDPDVAMDQYGNFVVTWSGVGEDDTSGVFARVFSASGQPAGPEFRVNQVLVNAQTVPAVAIDAEGNFVIAWASYGQDARSSAPTTSIYARLFNLYGSAVTGEFLVNSHDQGNQTNPQVATDANGNFVVIWQSEYQDGEQWGIYGQRYNSAGDKLGGEFRVNTRTVDKQQDPSVAMDINGNFVVVYTDFGLDGSDYGIYARRYSAAGVALDSAEFRVNQYTANYQWQPSVDMDNSGNFVVTWSTMGQDREDGVKDFGICARAFKADGTDWINPGTGTALGEFRVNANVIGAQITPDIAVDANGDFVVVWVGPDGNGTGVFHRPVGMTENSSGSSWTSGTGGTIGGGGTVITTSDIVGWAANGNWWVGESNGTNGFTNQVGTKWSSTVNWVDVMVGDFNGDGLDDMVGRNAANGDWWVGLSNGDGTFTNQKWTRWSPTVNWTDVMVGDFNGDGKDDIVGRNATNGDWWVAKSTGSAFTNTKWTRWSPTVNWTDVMVGDFNNDGRDDLVGRIAANGDWWVANSTGTGFTNAKWTRWSPTVNWLDVMVGDFNNDGRDDLVGRVAANGDWWVASSTGSAFTNAKWTRWSATAGWDHVMVGNFAAAAMHAEAAPAADQPAAEAITLADLQPVVEEAVLRSSVDLEAMAFQVYITDLAGLKLAVTYGNTILIDDDAAGFGWYVDTTDAAFKATDIEGELQALAGSEAAQRVDLLTVVMHEMGHLLGHNHDDEGLMQSTLSPGVRLLPAGDLAPASVEAYRTMAWLDDLATTRRAKSNSSVQVQAVDEALKVYWS